MNTAAEELLNAIEQAEMRSLTWGYVDGSLTSAEVIRLAQSLAASKAMTRSEEDCEELIEDLIDAQLLFERRGRLRSRFAETVRLMVRSRQMFRAEQWRGAPRLVADFRVDRRPRLFPHRDVLPKEVWEHMPAIVRGDTMRRRFWDALTQNDQGEPLTLARFQARAAARLLNETPTDNATIVTAGTGSGKTFCFYLPALTEIATQVASGTEHTLALALYPRVELLKDQLREAVRLSDRLTPLLQSSGARPLRIGVYYGDTPRNWEHFASPYPPKNWKRQGRGYICPFIRCLKCDGPLAWSEDDAAAGQQRLRCVTGRCNGEINNVVLTRDALKAGGCDLLFVTTESLNARITERELRPILGLDRPSNSKPLFVLLDEVHTYAGAPGAQVALTMSRWRNALGPNAAIRWIGLSATLRDADEFFATMTGVPAVDVATISPAIGECFERGAEYQIVLRGDPSGQTSLMSTTIQTAMLIGRMADNVVNRTGGVVGRKTFLFTDDLDVNNRLYHSLADAEGYLVRNNRLLPDGQRAPLAALRGDGAEALERDQEGQRWWAVDEIELHSLEKRLPLGRTTSQDSGVDVSATVVVATASLEVGFNDTTVGFVIQHKAPRGSAGFLQRKGRAGRSQAMRPWMITVLSDYGRDRAAFASYEQLFDPSLPPTNLPVSNLYVLRIQATFSLLEWLYQRWENKPPFAYLWNVVARPKGYLKYRRIIADVLSSLLRNDDPSLRRTLGTHIERALRIPRDRVQLLLWQPPRGIMLEVIPTLLRRLSTDWLLAYPTEPGETEPFERTPLPEFLPSRLFSELQLPEIKVTPDQGQEEVMAVGSALNMLVPGRVSRRFSPFDSTISHWLPVDVESAEAAVQVELADYIPMYDRVEINGVESQVVRPRQMRMEKIPEHVLPTSNARWQWNSVLNGGEAPEMLTVPSRGPWASLVSRVDAHTYSRRSPVRVQRYAADGEASLRLKSDGRVSERSIHFALRLHGKTAAVGLEQDVDGLRILIHLPSEAALASRNNWPDDALAVCRTMLFRDVVVNDSRLRAYGNAFQLDWIAQVFLAATIVAADANGWDFATSCERVTVRELEDAVGILFPTMETPNAELTDYQEEDDDTDHVDSLNSPRIEQKLVRTLRQLFNVNAVVASLRELALSAAQPDADLWGRWLRKLLCETVAVTLGEAVALILPRNNVTDTLLSDWEWDATSETMTLWLTEQALGGAGLVEELTVLCGNEPRKLFRAAEAALAATDAERASEALSAMCRRICLDDVFAKTAERCAESLGHGQRVMELDALADTLRRSGHAVGRTFGVSANSRLLRPGMQVSTWRLLVELDDYRIGLQARQGFIVDLRVFCRIAVVHPQYGTAVRSELARLRGGIPVGDGESAQILSGILWPQPAELRAAHRPSWHPYRDIGVIETGLLRALLDNEEPATVDVCDPQWKTRIAEYLSQQGSARLSAFDADREKLSDAITSLASVPIDTGWLHLYAAVERIESAEGRLTVLFELREIG